MFSMPRRKQDAPQRLNCKDGIGPISNVDSVLVDSKFDQEPEEEDHDVVTSLKSSEVERVPEELCNMEETEAQNIINHKKFFTNVSVDKSSIEKMSENFTKKRSSSANDLHDSEADEASFGNVKVSNNETNNSNDVNVTAKSSRDDTSLLHTLAAAAAFRSTGPGTVDEQPESPSSSGSFKMADSSMPIKKRAKRPLSPENIIPNNELSCDAKKTVGGNSDVDFAATNHLPVSNHVIHQNVKKDIDNVAKQHASQLHLMEAMMHRQRQLYEECTENNWMKMQRTDNNCLSKSKAKRYRWCVQKRTEEENEENNNNNSHQSAVSNTARPTEHSSFSGNMKKTPAKRQVNPMHDKLYGTVFTGASKFRCRDCGNPFNTLVDLTVHMNKTGHYRDQNIGEIKGRNETSSGNLIKPKKRPVSENEEKESAEKVLKCLGCGHSFDSLQDLTVHMIKTKHYEDVPSLRFYSQKNEFCANTANGPSQSVMNDDQISLSSSQHNNNNIANDRSDVHSSNGQQPILERQSDQNTELVRHVPPMMYGGFPNLANMQALAAQSLFGGFSPYMMPGMGVPGGMNGYGQAFAAAAASLLLSAPWLMQVPGFGAANMFPSYLNPHAAFQNPGFTHHMSPGDSGVITPPPASRSATPPSRSHPSPTGSHTPNESRYKEDINRSKSQILCCSQCRKSFNSLQKLTNHMREAGHFPNAPTPPIIDATGFRNRRSDELSGNATAPRVSPYPKQYSPPSSRVSGPTSSPLEHLAKLASGKSLGQLNSNSFAKPKIETPPKKQYTKSTSRNSPPQNSIFSREKYIQLENKESSRTNSLTGFDFIKSLETTIQSAISKVNEPTRSPIQENKFMKQTSLGDEQKQNFHQQQRQFVFNQYVPTQDGRQLTQEKKNFTVQGKCSNVTTHVKKDKRPASDGEEYQQRKRMNSAYKLERYHASPPLDLSKSLQHDDTTGSRKRSSDGTKINENGRCKNGQICKKNSHLSEKFNDIVSTANPIQCIKDKMQTWFNSNPKKVPNSHKDVESKSVSKDVRRRSDDGVSVHSGVKDSYTRFVDNHKSDREKSNPLQEMQKIVNSTELARRPESLTDVAAKDERGIFETSRNQNGCRKRSSENESNHKIELKRYKPGSVLSDLVRHENDSPPTINPLAQMEYLVNLKIGDNTIRTVPSPIAHSTKPNLAKPYEESMRNDESSEPKNGTNPMSALLSLFKSANNDHVRPNSYPSRLNNDVRRQGSDDVISKPPKKAKRHRDPQIKIKSEKIKVIIPSSSTEHENLSPPDETTRLRDKMADFFRSMMAQDRVLRNPVSVKQEPQSPGGNHDESKIIEKKSSVNLRPLQELQLQIIFASNFENISKNIVISENEMERLSSTTDLSVDYVKDWIAQIRKQLMEIGKCSFIKLSKSKGTPKYRCNSCITGSNQNLSAADFLQHLSTHINGNIKSESSRRSSHEELTNWSYRGAMRFEPLKPEDSPPPSYSLTAHVTESPVEPMMRDYTPSPPTEVVPEQRRCADGMKVTEDSPIQVSG